jgi:hypothetical protein
MASRHRYIVVVKTNRLATVPRPTVSTCFRLFLEAEKSGNTSANLAEFNPAIVQRLAEQVRQRMLGAVGMVPASALEHSTTTLVLSTARLPLVLERIARFRCELISLLQDERAPDDVYQLEINFFPVTNLQSDKENFSGTARDAVADTCQTTG